MPCWNQDAAVLSCNPCKVGKSPRLNSGAFCMQLHAHDMMVQTVAQQLSSTHPMQRHMRPLPAWRLAYPAPSVAAVGVMPAIPLVSSNCRTDQGCASCAP